MYMKTQCDSLERAQTVHIAKLLLLNIDATTASQEYITISRSESEWIINAIEFRIR